MSVYVATGAVADEAAGETEQSVMTPSLIQEAAESPDKLQPLPTDPAAAEELPHNELERGQALELLDAVFGAEVEEPGGLIENLPVERYLSDHAAIVSSPEPPDSAKVIGEEGQPPEEAPSEPELVESTLPLRTEAPSGEKVPVDLSLERSEGELQPTAPLVEAEIPGELGDGISIGNSELSLKLLGAAGERAPTDVEGEAAFYPNVQADTDFLVEPIPTGVETWTQLRTAESPTNETFHLGLPEGAVLKETTTGGVEASLDGKTLLNVPPATAVDAAGHEVPVELSVEGQDVEVTTTPVAGTQFPVLVDPTWQFESWNWIWGTSSFAAWYPYHTDPSYQALTYGFPATENHALDMTSGFAGSANVLSRAEWTYYVPRYFSDQQNLGHKPDSFIDSGQLEAAMFLLEGNNAYNPVEDAGIIDDNKNEWVSVGTHRGTEGEISGWSGKYWFPNENPTTHEKDTHARVFTFQLATLEYEAQAKYRTALAGEAIVGFGDHNAPEVVELTPPTSWLNTSEGSGLVYGVADPGLGVYEVQLAKPINWGNETKISKTNYKVGCTGIPTNPCPEKVESSESSRPKVAIEPQYMPEGRDTITFKAMDPLGTEGIPPNSGSACCGEPYPHATEQGTTVKIDHSAPAVSLAGSLTEQGTLGTSKPQYTLSYSATDGVEQSPQLQASGATNYYSHPADAAFDSAENRWVADENNNRIVKVNQTNEAVATYSAVGTESLSHPAAIDIDASNNVWVADSGHNRLVEFNSKGEWARKVNGLSSPQALAVAPNGNIWVADTGNNQIVEYSPTGTVVGTFSSKGSAAGQLLEPSGIDVAPNGNVWVSDSGNNRLEVFNGKGELLAAYGSLGSGQGQLNHPDGLDVDTRGSVWVVDAGNNRVEQFSERGEYLGSFGTPGAGEGQFNFAGPASITTNVAGTLWVTDSGNNRISRWAAPVGTRSGVRHIAVKIDGETVQEPSVTCPQGGCPMSGEWTLDARKYSAGSHTVEVTATDGVGLPKTEKLNITLNPPAPGLALSGTLTEQATLGTTRPRYILNAEAAPYGQGAGSVPPTFISAFGSSGSGNGQLSGPRGVASDGKGHVWIVDRANNRVEEFNEAGEYIGQFGSGGNGNGQFSEPWGIAVTPAGNLWVTDTGNKRVEEFSSEGKFLQKFGTAAAGESKGTEFSGPEGIAVAPGGNLWVADYNGSRVAEFRETVSSESERFVRNTSGKALELPRGLAVDASGNLWVANVGSNQLIEFGPEGAFIRTVASGGSGDGQISNPGGVGFDSAGRLYVVDQGNNRVDIFNAKGEFLAKFGTTGTGNAQFTEPKAIAFGAGAAMFITDKGNNRVHRWGASWEAAATFIAAFGSSGSGNGQLSGPRGIASDGKGHVWIVDRANNRVEEFDESGAYIGQFGSGGNGNGQFSEPWGIAVTPAGNLWVTDTGNKRIEEFNSEGKFLQKFGTAAAGESKGSEFLGPEGIAIAPGGNLWVADYNGNRVAEFRETVSSESERWVRNTSGKALEAPRGLAVDGGGNVWVANVGSNQLLEFGPEGAFVRSVGSSGSGNGQISNPGGVGFDPSGRVYVVDQGNNRVDIFNTAGTYIGKFGSSGTGNAQFTEPKAIAFGAGGSMFVTDKGNNRVHKWSQPELPDPIASIEVLVEGKAVSASPTSCLSASCSVAKQWTLNSLEYLGSKTVSVRATSAAGFTTTKALSVKEQRDEAKPSIEIGGELSNAPEGWVQQENYGFTATGTDPAGYGVTSLNFKIDGSSVASTTKSCSEGGCEASIAKGVSMAPYSGGAHSAEVAATDGAGNVAIKRWTINVDPEGHISTTEATATAEAIEGTSPNNLVGGSKEELGLEGSSAGLGLESTATGYLATGSAAPTEISASQPGLTVEIPASEELYGCAEEAEEAEEPSTEGLAERETGTAEAPCPALLATELPDPLPVKVEPLEVASNFNVPFLVEENAVVIANTQLEVDTTTRPLSDGGMIFEDIRDPSGPEEFSYRVNLSEEQELVQIDERTVQVYLGSFPSFTITAKAASDAIGTSVPTTLKKTGRNVVTLTVHHRSGLEGHPFVYPVVGGSGWEGGFTTVEVDMDNLSPEAAGEEIEGEGTVEEAQAIERIKVRSQGPPVADASSSQEIQEVNPLPVFHHKFKFNECRYKYPPTETNGGTIPPEQRRVNEAEHVTECLTGVEKRPLLAAMSVHGWFNISPGYYVRVPNDVTCNKWGREQPAKIACGKSTSERVHEGSVEVWGHFRFAPLKAEFFSGPTSACVTVHGTINREPKVLRQLESVVTPTRAAIPEHPEFQEPCHWP